MIPWWKLVYQTGCRSSKWLGQIKFSSEMRLQVHRQQIKHWFSPRIVLWDNLQDAAMIGNKTQRGFPVIFSQNSGSPSWNFDEFGTHSASDKPEELMNKQVQAGKAKNFSEAFDVVFSRPGASKFYFASWMLGRKQEFFGSFWAAEIVL